MRYVMIETLRRVLAPIIRRLACFGETEDTPRTNMNSKITENFPILKMFTWKFMIRSPHSKPFHPHPPCTSSQLQPPLLTLKLDRLPQPHPLLLRLCPRHRRHHTLYLPQITPQLLNRILPVEALICNIRLQHRIYLFEEVVADCVVGSMCRELASMFMSRYVHVVGWMDGRIQSLGGE